MKILVLKYFEPRATLTWDFTYETSTRLSVFLIHGKPRLENQSSNVQCRAVTSASGLGFDSLLESFFIQIEIGYQFKLSLPRIDCLPGVYFWCRAALTPSKGRWPWPSSGKIAHVDKFAKFVDSITLCDKVCNPWWWSVAPKVYLFLLSRKEDYSMSTPIFLQKNPSVYNFFFNEKARVLIFLW